MTMKKHVDTLLHVIEGVSARLTLLETRTHNLENLVDYLEVSVQNSHGSTHGKMRQLEYLLVEVQSGVQLLKDQHEIFEAQLQFPKLQVSKVDQHPKTHSVHVDPTAQSPAPFTPLQIPQFPLTSFPQPPSSAAALSQQMLQPPSSHQSHQPPSSQLLAQLPTQFSPQQEPYCPPLSHSQPPPPTSFLIKLLLKPSCHINHLTSHLLSSHSTLNSHHHQVTAPRNIHHMRCSLTRQSLLVSIHQLVLPFLNSSTMLLNLNHRCMMELVVDLIQVSLRGTHRNITHTLVRQWHQQNRHI